MILISFATFFFVQYDSHPRIQQLTSALTMIKNQLGNRIDRATKNSLTDQQKLSNSSYITEPNILDEIVSISDLAVGGGPINGDGREADNVDFVELDTHSTSGSTHNLINYEG